MGNWKWCVIVGLAVLALGNLSGFAQQANPTDGLQQAKLEVEGLYTQWRQAKPSDPITTNAFWAYLHTQPQQNQLSYNSFVERIEPITQPLPSGVWILSTYVPTTGKLLGFYVDLNGSKQPNGNLFGESTDQFRFEMDNSGHIGQ